MDTFSIVVMHVTLCSKIECWSIRSSLFRMSKILSYVKCMWFTGYFSLTLSIWHESWFQQTNAQCKIEINRPLDKKVCNWKLFFLFPNQSLCCGYSKEPSQQDGSFEHPKHMFKLVSKKIFTILETKSLFIWSYVFRAYEADLFFDNTSLIFPLLRQPPQTPLELG